jgi:S1-C subfamily serine protease
LTNISTDDLASKLGFKNGDLIQTINETKISNIRHLKDYLFENSANKNHVFVIIRNQAKVKVTVNQALPLVYVSY